MVRQHDAAGADPDAAGLMATRPIIISGAEQETGRIMVLGQPIRA